MIEGLNYKDTLPDDFKKVEKGGKKYRVKTIEDLTVMQRKFCENILKGMTITDAYLEAGYMSKQNHNDRKVRKTAYENAYNLMNSPLVHNYLAMNVPPEPELVVSEDSLIERLFLIFGGQTEIKQVSKNGDTYYAPPSFKDQIYAAQTLLQIIKLKEGKAPKDIRVSAISKRMSELTKDIRKTAVLENSEPQEERSEPSEERSEPLEESETAEPKDNKEAGIL